MTVTEYAIDDICFTLNARIKKHTIVGIESTTNRNNVIKTNYVLLDKGTGNETTISEKRIYRTKFEAAKVWLLEQNLEPNDVIQSVFADRKEKDKEI